MKTAFVTGPPDHPEVHRTAVRLITQGYMVATSNDSHDIDPDATPGQQRADRLLADFEAAATADLLVVMSGYDHPNVQLEVALATTRGARVLESSEV